MGSRGELPDLSYFASAPSLIWLSLMRGRDRLGIELQLDAAPACRDSTRALEGGRRSRAVVSTVSPMGAVGAGEGGEIRD